MSKKTKTVSQKQDEEQIRNLSRSLQELGVTVRREKLTRGHSFRVKSGGCYLSDQQTLFVDKNLHIAHQLSVLIDFIVERKIEIPQDVIDDMSPQVRSLLPTAVEEAVSL